MFRSTKRIIISLVATSLLTGGAITAPSIINAVTAPAKVVTVQSFKVVDKNVATLNGTQKETSLCMVDIKHSKTNLKATIPTPVEFCSMLSKGQDVTLKANEIILKL